jgi:MoaA/NifB/PqqE/SkfB family radical SAM enzyme
MCARNLQGGVDNPFMSLNEITKTKFIEWFSPDFIKQLSKLYMCGNLGDPIIAKDTAEIFKHCRELNPNITLSMNTNGSARTAKFWEQLAELNVQIRFGIDGDHTTHSLYRKGTDYDMIIKNAVTFINKGGYAIWDMLVFDHNQDQVDNCKKLSEQLGFKQFVVKNTARFKEDRLDVIDTSGRKIYTLYPSQKSIRLSKTEIKPSSIQCKVKFGSLYVTCNGIVTPCCWLGIDELPHHNPSRIDYISRIGKFYSLEENTLEEIFDSKVFDIIENTWNNSPLIECSKQCGNYDKFNSQF